MLRKNLTIIAFNAITAIATAAGITLAPEAANEYAEALITLGGGAWIIINAFLIRWQSGKTGTTTTPPAAAILAVVLLAGMGLTACASRVAETPAQKVYAITADLQAASVVVLAYVESPQANADVKAILRKLYLAADDALLAAQKAVRSGESAMVPVLISAAGSAVNELFAYMSAAGILGMPPPAKAVTAALPELIPARELRHDFA